MLRGKSKLVPVVYVHHTVHEIMALKNCRLEFWTKIRGWPICTENSVRQTENISVGQTLPYMGIPTWPEIRVFACCTAVRAAAIVVKRLQMTSGAEKRRAASLPLKAGCAGLLSAGGSVGTSCAAVPQVLLLYCRYSFVYVINTAALQHIPGRFHTYVPVPGIRLTTWEYYKK